MGKFQLFPQQASTLAPEVDHLLYFLLAVTVFFPLLIFRGIFYFAIKYRRRSEREPPPRQHTRYPLAILCTRHPFGLRHQPFRYDRWGSRDGARGLSELDQRRRRRRLAGGKRQEPFRPPRL